MPAIITYRGGERLKAARCALGCMGVIVAVELQTTSKYLVEETVRVHPTLEDVLLGARVAPLSQFVLMPFSWEYVAWERTATGARERSRGERLKAWLLRFYDLVWIDVLFHLGLEAALALGDPVVKWLMRTAPRLFIVRGARVDDAEHILTLRHDLFRHEEMELFVPEARLAEAVALLQCATDVFAGEAASVPEPLETTLNLHNLHGALIRQTGSYVHHYPFVFRRVLPEDTLISMASGTAEPYYSISVFTYLAPEKRQPYYAFCAWLARAMSRLFGARLHWGKHFPLNAVEIARLYPELETFRQVSRTVDPNGVFRNDFTRRVLGV
jgi:FAD/FMN-containing dehydrogenase